EGVGPAGPPGGDHVDVGGGRVLRRRSVDLGGHGHLGVLVARKDLHAVAGVVDGVFAEVADHWEAFCAHSLSSLVISRSLPVTGQRWMTSAARSCTSATRPQRSHLYVASAIGLKRVVVEAGGCRCRGRGGGDRGRPLRQLLATGSLSLGDGAGVGVLDFEGDG